MTPTPTSEILTDAAMTGWGAVWWGLPGERRLAVTPDITPHKRPGDEGRLHSSIRVGSPTSRQCLQAILRHFDSSSLPKEGRRVSIYETVSRDSQGHESTGQPQDNATGSPPTGRTQRDGRPAVTRPGSEPHRMAPRTRSSKQTVLCFRPAAPGHVGDKGQRSDPVFVSHCPDK